LDLPAARSASIRFASVQEKEAELMLREAQDSNPKSTIQNSCPFYFGSINKAADAISAFESLFI